MSWARRPHRPIAVKATAPPAIMTWASTQYKRPLAHPATAFTVGTPSRQGREAVGATGSGAAVLAHPKKESDFWWPLATAFGSQRSVQIPVAMLWDTVGQGQAKRSRPPHHRGPAQLPASPAQREEHRQEQEALRAQLEGERLRSQELLRCHTAKRRELQEVAQRRLFSQYIVGSWEGKPQHVESHAMSCSQDRERALGRHCAEQGSSRPAVKDAHVQVRWHTARVGIVQPGGGEALGTPQSSLPVPEGGLGKAGEGLVVREGSDTTKDSA